MTFDTLTFHVSLTYMWLWGWGQIVVKLMDVFSLDMEPSQAAWTNCTPTWSTGAQPAQATRDCSVKLGQQ